MRVVGFRGRESPGHAELVIARSPMMKVVLNAPSPAQRAPRLGNAFYGAGFTQRTSGNRLKSRSVEARTAPFSKAIAASAASLTSGPTLQHELLQQLSMTGSRMNSSFRSHQTKPAENSLDFAGRLVVPFGRTGEPGASFEGLGFPYGGEVWDDVVYLVSSSWESYWPRFSIW